MQGRQRMGAKGRKTRLTAQLRTSGRRLINALRYGVENPGSNAPGLMLRGTLAQLKRANAELDKAIRQLVEAQHAGNLARQELESTRRERDTAKQTITALKRELETTTSLLPGQLLSIANTACTTKQKLGPPIAQIFISKDNGKPGELIQNCIRSVQRCFPASRYKLYTNEEIIELIRDHYDAKVLEAYLGLKPFAYKADLGRLCILGITGGWYVDVGVTWATPVTIPAHIKLFTARDRNHVCRSAWACNNAIIYSHRNHPAIQHGIDQIVYNFNRNYYGHTSLCPTGPNTWGRAIAATCDPAETLFCDIWELTPRYPHKNLAFISEDGRIIAFAKPSIGGDGLHVFGEDGSNSYNEYWRKRDIYDRNMPFG